LEVTAAVPRELRIDPCEKKTKGVSSRAGAKECCLGCLQAGIIAIACPLLTSYYGNGAAKFAKRLNFG
jgi:hypothetical protein